MTPASPNTVHIGTLEQFARAREMLLHARFNEADICERCGSPDIYEAQRGAPTRKEKKEQPADALDAFIRLFVDGYYIEQGQLLRFLSYEDLGLLNHLGLLVQDAARASLCYCPVTLVPVSDCYVICDRAWAPDGGNIQLAEDVVYPAAVPNTRRLLRLMPHHTCDAFLDLCSGTGIAALIAARDFAARSVAVDIAPRSVHFAEFNRLLNGLANVQNLAGDLYDPVRGQKFDFISAHPPYVPVLAPKWIFHDGGPDGEQVVRGIIQGAPAHLKRGGTLFMQAMGTDRTEGTFEQRIRRWLGESESDFDVAVVTRSSYEPQDFALRLVAERSSDAGDIGRWKQLFTDLQITNLLLGFIIIRRKDSNRPAFTVRRQLGAQTGRSEIEWLLWWEAEVANGAAARRVLELPLDAMPKTELRMVNRLENHEWQTVAYLLQTDYPFSMESRTQPWIAQLVSECDGKKTGMDHFRNLIDTGVIYPETRPEEFAGALVTLISGGFVKL